MKFVFVSEEFIKDLKDRLDNPVGVYEELKYELNQAAQEFLYQGPWSITDYPAQRSKGTINDYYSEAPYYWPDPEDPTKPYIGKDGQVNPDRFTIHKNIFATMSHALLSLSAAGYLLENDEYLEKAACIARTWFVNPETRMNPNIEYGEAIINLCPGRKSGIIACTSMDVSIHAFSFLEASGLFAELIDDIRTWVRDMLRWLTTSKLGIEESRSENNHFTWWNTHVASAAAFVGDDAQFGKCMENFKEKVVGIQIDPEGSIPRELLRTRSLHYTLFNLDAMTMMCELAYQKGFDLWNYESSDGRCIKKAINFFMKGVDNPYSWKHQQIVGDIPLDEMCLQYAALRLDMPEALKINKKRSEGCYMIKIQSPIGPVALLEGYPMNQVV